MNKPNDLISSLGPNVEMGSETLENDTWANKMLKDIGDTLTKKQQNAGMEYLGSFAVHIVATKGMGLDGKMSMASLTQICVDENCSEKLMVLALSNATIQLRRAYNPNAGTGHRFDKR